ncbi:MAG: 30S ribosomal protein S12 methylthiotransferase RimO, partial [Gemmatimonadota bacterium]|nr:30S ribosomal protein S12 methylthiotransferase RimO [Gemmatimonadota bacterium]
EVMELQREISLDRNLELVGSIVTVLVDESLDDDPEFDGVGRTVGQAVDVDGVTHLRSASAMRAGDMLSARVVEAGDYDLVAEVLH